MLAELIGGVIGERIDESDGEGGVVGAALGAATAVVLKRLIPLALLGGGLMAAKYYYNKKFVEKPDRPTRGG